MTARRSTAPWLLIAAGGMVLFLSIGARQGFGLYFAPIHADLSLAREEFARAVAVQYLLWGIVGPAAGVLAERYSSRVTLVVGGALYTAGLVAASATQTADGWLLSAGALVGLGLGGASFGVVTAAVVQGTPRERRGAALGAIGALTALGQLLLLLYTELTIQWLGWRGSLLAAAALTVAIVPLSLLLPGPSAATRMATGDARQGWAAISHALRRTSFWLMGLGFAFSGFHVMFTMTHAPAWLGDMGMSSSVAVQALGAISLTSFVGAWIWGRLCDRIRAEKLLVVIYCARAAMAILAAVLPFSPITVTLYFALLGLFWMGTIPITSHLTAQLFGEHAMASVYGTVFLLHQAGGFAGTWLGGLVFDHHGSYRPMWFLIAALCLIGAALALALPSADRDGHARRHA